MSSCLRFPIRSRQCLANGAAWFLFLSVGLIWSSVVDAQGPSIEYFYNPDTTLEWASCAVTQEGGSSLRVPFLPVVLRAPIQAPSGTSKYTRNIVVDAPLVFVGDGIVSDSWNAYERTFDWEPAPIDVGEKAVLICYDCINPGVAEDSVSASLSSRVLAAASRGAVAVVLFSREKEAPFLYFDGAEPPSPEIPVVTVSPSIAAAILDADAPGGGDLLDQLAAGDESPMSRSLLPRLELRIDGEFDRLESDNFVFLFRGSRVSRVAVEAAVRVHEAALDGIRGKIGSDEDLPWPKSTMVYFAGFDSKLFFTHHWGFGLSNAAGTFLQWDGGAPVTGKIVHEQTHTFTALNWGHSSSFIDEGVAQYVEGELTDPNMNHQAVLCMLNRDEVPPLQDMLYIDVGGDELTPIAYPSAGSFIGYLMKTGGLKTVRRVYELEGRDRTNKQTRDTWKQVLSMQLQDVDQSWRSWVRQRESSSDCSN